MFDESAGRELRTSARIDLSALEANYRAVKRVAAPDATLLCVVKADAYGHGAVEVGRRLQAIGAVYFGVATIDEGRELREKGISVPILVLSGVMPWESLEPLIEYNLNPVLATAEMVERVASFGHRRPLKVHVKVDTGMGRLGCSPGEVGGLAKTLAGLKHVEVEGIMSHFASSERRDDYGFRQIDDFRRIVDTFLGHGIEPRFLHMANSSAICNYPEAHFNMVRPGIVLYGAYPDAALADRLQLTPVMSWLSRVASVRAIAKGVSLSYGRTYVTTRTTKVAYIPVGYADGYPVGLSNKGTILVQGVRCPVVGRVCMEWILADVTSLADVRPGDEVFLIGSAGGDETITADELAVQAGTIPYEILCGVSRRVPRLYG